MSTKLSIQQQEVFDWVLKKSGSLSLIARAGTGKTFTLTNLAEFLVKGNSTTSIVIGAYNRPIANEVKLKIEDKGITWKNCLVNTIHGIAFSAWRKIAPKACENVDDKKCANLLAEEMKSEEQKRKVMPYKSVILKTVSLAKSAAFGITCQIDDQSKWYALIDHYGIDEDMPDNDSDMEFVVKCCIWLYKRSLMRCHEVIDFDDMILAPLYFKAKFWQYDWVFIDEAQDTNPARLAIISRILKRTGRLIAVGDPAQAIYGFAGADTSSLDVIQKTFNTTILPLNVTYRCPKVVVRRAQQWVPDFTAHESAPEGVERVIYQKPDSAFPDRKTVDDETFDVTSAIICRNNAPLVDMAYKLLKRGIPCHIEGRNIAARLIELCERWGNITNLSVLIDKVTDWKELQIAKFVAKGQDNKADEISDRADTIIVLAQQLLSEGKKKIKDLTDFIDSMFQNTNQGDKPKTLTLCSAHKSKGREWKTVYILGQDRYMPSPWARKTWQKEQEMNLMYVATTRSQYEIVDIIVKD
jgi:DNA helicase-2/ATP-dependent DNA helicase PcrA